MARIAIHGGVSADQRETVLVLLDLLNADAPSFHRVTTLAVGSELAPMDIRVAIRAFCSDIREDEFGMTLDARNVLVHAAQRVAGFVVIEFRNSADRLPSRLRVAVLTGSSKVPVRAASAQALPGARQGERGQEH